MENSLHIVVANYSDKFSDFLACFLFIEKYKYVINKINYCEIIGKNSCTVFTEFIAISCCIEGFYIISWKH